MAVTARQVEERRSGIERPAPGQQAVDHLRGVIGEPLNLGLPLIFHGSRGDHQNPLNAAPAAQQPGGGQCRSASGSSGRL